MLFARARGAYALGYGHPFLVHFLLVAGRAGPSAWSGHQPEKDRPKLEEIKRAASEDVARIEEDDKYFGSNAPSEGDAL